MVKVFIPFSCKEFNILGNKLAHFSQCKTNYPFEYVTDTMGARVRLKIALKVVPFH